MAEILSQYTCVVILILGLHLTGILTRRIFGDNGNWNEPGIKGSIPGPDQPASDWTGESNTKGGGGGKVPEGDRPISNSTGESDPGLGLGPELNSTKGPGQVKGGPPVGYRPVADSKAGPEQDEDGGGGSGPERDGQISDSTCVCAPGEKQKKRGKKKTKRGKQKKPKCESSSDSDSDSDDDKRRKKKDLENLKVQKVH